MISHRHPTKKGKLAQLKLSSYLAFMLGYTSIIENKGQYLRFDEHSEHLASHKPKLSIDYCRDKHIQYIHKDEDVQLLLKKIF